LEGKAASNYPGLMFLFDRFMTDHEFPKEKAAEIREFLNFQVRRARGEVQTGATFIRNIVRSHPEYKKDSVVSPKIAYDLMGQILQLASDPSLVEKFLGKGTKTF
jgi:glutamate--cysteine ligase catalytic subunit